MAFKSPNRHQRLDPGGLLCHSYGVCPFWGVESRLTLRSSNFNITRRIAGRAADSSQLAIAFYLLRETLFGRKNGWLVMWVVLATIGIFSTFGPTPGSIEGLIFTTLPLWSHLFGLPEVLLQSLLFSAVLCHWVNHPERRWLNWVLGILFFLVLALPLLGLLLG